MSVEVFNYQEFSYTSIKADSPEEIVENTADIARVELPAKPQFIEKMSNKGFSFVDRTLGVVINLKRTDIDYKKLVRFDVHRGIPGNDVLDIALNSFPTDRRFHVRHDLDQTTADVIIRDWVSKLNEVYVCTHKDQVVGFLDLEPVGDDGKFIHLAAVKEQYRAAGAAVSLYAFAILSAIESGANKVYGRISSTNTAVMNLYTHLGGSFSDPIDVYVKESKL